MTLYGEFKDINDKKYFLEITSDTNQSQSADIILGANPITITSSSDGLFAPIKSRSMSIELYSKEWYLDLYSPTSRGTRVKLQDENNVVIFRGYMTPCSYDQSFTYVDTITLEAVDALSTTKDFKYTVTGEYTSFFNIIINILKEAGYQGKLYIPKTYTKLNGNNINSDILEKLYVSEYNFLDDNEEKTPWTQYEVLTEIMKFMGWSLIPFGDDVYIIDYRGEYHDSVTYYVFDIQSFTQQANFTSPQTPTQLTLDDFAPGTSTIEIDDIYNKIEISDNLYEIEDISPDIFDDGLHISITDEKNLGLNSWKWTKTKTKGILWWRDRSQSITGYDYQTICRLKDSSGWKHYYYKMSDVGTTPTPTPLNNEDGLGYYDPNSNSIYTTQTINKYCNTHGCLIQHYAHVDNEGENNVPATIDWTDILTFFITNDTTPNFSMNNITNLELPVLEYTTSEVINWKPSSGCSWITIKGDILYQYNGVNYKDGKDKTVLSIINENEKSIFSAPVDKAVSITDKTYCLLSRKKSHADYGKGFSCLKMKLQIGNKYWNGDTWTNTESVFYIKFNNNPDGDNDENIPAFTWASTVNNKGYKDKVGVDGYCIPVDAEDDDAPNNGIMKMTIYSPSLIPSELRDYFNQLFPNIFNDLNWKTLAPIVYVKDFELGYTYTDTQVWWNNHTDNKKADKVYIGYINDNFVQDFDSLEFKINTAVQDRPISRSFVTVDGGGYLDTMKHKNNNSEKAQEYNVIDEYLDHYSERKIIFNRNTHGLLEPYLKFTKQQFDNQIFMIDSYSIDLRNDNNDIKYIAY